MGHVDAKGETAGVGLPPNGEIIFLLRPVLPGLAVTLQEATGSVHLTVFNAEGKALGTLQKSGETLKVGAVVGKVHRVVAKNVGDAQAGILLRAVSIAIAGGAGAAGGQAAASQPPAAIQRDMGQVNSTEQRAGVGLPPNGEVIFLFRPVQPGLAVSLQEVTGNILLTVYSAAGKAIGTLRKSGEALQVGVAAGETHRIVVRNQGEEQAGFSLRTVCNTPAGAAGAVGGGQGQAAGAPSPGSPSSGSQLPLAAQRDMGQIDANEQNAGVALPAHGEMVFLFRPALSGLSVTLKQATGDVQLTVFDAGGNPLGTLRKTGDTLQAEVEAGVVHRLVARNSGDTQAAVALRAICVELPPHALGVVGLSWAWVATAAYALLAVGVVVGKRRQLLANMGL